MIYCHLSQWRTTPGLPVHNVWSSAFLWLENVSADVQLGFHNLGQEGFYARVMQYSLKHREEARYESHRETVDIQLSLDGGEGIELASLSQLQSLNDYDASKDVEHFQTPHAGIARVNNMPGWCSVLFPGEPHMPQLAIADIDAVRKVVVKIPRRLVI